MKKYLIILTCLILCIPEMHGQGKKLIEGIQKGLMFKHHYPIATKLGKPTDLYVQVKSLNSEWIKTIKKANYLTDDIIINRNLNQNKLILERKAPSWVLFDEPIQKVVLTGDETDLSNSFRIIQEPEPGVTGFRVEEIWTVEGDSVPLARNFLNIEVESTQKVIFKDKTKKQEKRDYTVQPLFYRYQELGKDVEKETKRLSDEFLAFLKHENFETKHFRANRRDDIAMAFVSFYKRWQEMKIVSPGGSVNGSACYRFLTEDCNLNCSDDIKAFGKFIHRTVNAQTKKHKGEEKVNQNIDKKVENWFSTHRITH